MEIAFSNYLDVAEDLIKSFNKKFVIRPHPFECDKIYKNRFGKYKNCKIKQNENIFQAIYNSECNSFKLWNCSWIYYVKKIQFH